MCAANSADFFKKTGTSTVTTLSAPGKALGATSINVGSTTGYPSDTGIVISIRTVDTSGNLIAGTHTEWSGTVTSGTSIAIEAAPVYGSDQIYAAGSTTQIAIRLSNYSHNKLVDGLLISLDQDGTLKAGAGLTVIYPVGSIYIATVSTNPATLFGFGTWVAFGEGRVIVGVGTSDAVYAAAATGGASTHTLQTTEIPSHNHTNSEGSGVGSNYFKGYVGGGTVNSPGGGNKVITGNAGGGLAHNNLQPYIVAYMWNRTA